MINIKQYETARWGDERQTLDIWMAGRNFCFCVVKLCSWSIPVLSFLECARIVAQSYVWCLQGGVWCVPHWFGGAESGAARRQHYAKDWAIPAAVPDPPGEVREDESRRVCEAEVPGGEQGLRTARFALHIHQLYFTWMILISIFFLLSFNQVKVLHNQLILFHNAIAAYYAGNQQQLEETLKQFHIKLKMPGGESPSWLEEH